MSTIPITVARNAMMIRINGNKGFTESFHASLPASASWIIPPTKIRIINVRKAINKPTIKPIKLLISTCHPLGL